ncbi:something about silencing protein 10-like [Meriones unguiculatus]|uniref:something about silencing protein 10-like n=1 Tax=Meriones unguiculatus TaxID=10047 RepID=UPI000B4F95D9|nr:something about silencing protein 10-like [Meriones unguiculatus]XP_060232753.1 something about silencing protein 10-like [Meriones unguiculatus]
MVEDTMPMSEERKVSSAVFGESPESLPNPPNTPRWTFFVLSSAFFTTTQLTTSRSSPYMEVADIGNAELNPLVMVAPSLPTLTLILSFLLVTPGRINGECELWVYLYEPEELSLQRGGDLKKKEDFSPLLIGMGLTTSLGTMEASGVALIQAHHLVRDLQDKLDQAMFSTADSLKSYHLTSFILLIEDLKVKLTEVKDELEPLLQLVEEGVIPPGNGSQYLKTKYNLYLNYCANISFYLILKARRAPAHGHPVIERLVSYRNLINDLSVVDQKLSSEIHHLLTVKDGAVKKGLNPKEKLTKTKAKAAATADPSEDPDFDEAALQYYKEMEDGQKLKRKKEENSAEEQALEDQNAKRAITYQIAKNRGLTPRRKKIDRNPRVKHREKFRRAKIRRRGQVREVHREEQRYSGELYGIRAGVKKSIKLK